MLESRINNEIHELAHSMFGVTTHWHKRIVRAGPNTLAPYDENPPDLTVGEDDILFLDFGPVFDEWEADFGRTFVLGSDPIKLRLRDDLEKGFVAGKQYFQGHPDITAAELYRFAEELALRYGWEYGGPIAGHLVGRFPHERIAGDKVSLYVHPDNPTRMRNPDAEGRERQAAHGDRWPIKQDRAKGDAGHDVGAQCGDAEAGHHQIEAKDN